jgi:flagellar basal body rod protein FlgC
MTELSILDTAAAGMDVQRALLDLAARNVAAAQVAGPDGTFERLVPTFAPRPLAEEDGVAFGAEQPVVAFDGRAAGVTFGAADGGSAVRLAGVRPAPGSEADALTEMVAVLDAQRAYEANASVFEAGKRLAERTIDLGRI